VTSPFFGLDIATRALRTQQTLVDISNQNIANANTPGFSRQEAVVKETLPYPIPVFRQSGAAGQLGTGVDVTTVNRSRDTFLDYQYRNQTAQQGRWDAQAKTLQDIEGVVNEPSANGISTLMTKYWSAWQEVANSPSDVSVRANLLEQGKALTDAFQSTVQAFQQQQRDVDQQLKLSVDDVNNFSQQIANLNTQISQVETAGMKANDLRDQRDLLVDKLSQLVKVTTVESSEGSLSIYLGGHQLVDRSAVHPMGLDTTSSQFAKVIWQQDPAPNNQVTLADGKMAGLVQSRDGILQDRIDNINALAGRIIQSVNAIHSAGVGVDGTGGLNFFTGTDATNIAVNSALTPQNVAAARMTGSGPYSHADGDASNAIALAALQNSVTQRSAGLDNGQTVGAAQLLGVDVGAAAPNKTFTFSVGAGPTVSVSDGTSTVAATWTKASNQPDGSSPTQDIYTLDTGQMGVRVTLMVPAGTPLSNAFSGLNGQTVSTAGPTTSNDQYAQEVASIGVLSTTAQGQSKNQQVLISQLTQQRQQVSGVSIDEEATHLIQYQHAYQAAARVISVMDSMLDTLINDTGAR
jgi:flagellar hook-associated protein 1